MSNASLAPAAAPSRPSANPFRGPCPLGEGDGPYLYGRDKDVSQLGDLVLARSEVVFHGPAGRGKTSLVRAGLLAWLRQRGCRLLPVARVQGPLGAVLLPKLPCVFAYHALASWAPPGTDPARLAGLTLADFLKDHRWTGRGRPTPLVLIFDPFDEFFTTHPQLDRHRERFFEQLRDAFKADPLLRVLFVAGDEYAPRLTQYAAALPERGAARLRLSRLNANEAFAVLKDTLTRGGWCADERALIALLGLLDGGGAESSIIESGSVPTVTARVVEPLLLQLVGRCLCGDRQLVPEPGQLGVEAAGRFVEGHRGWGLNQYLEELYEGVLAEVARTSDTPQADLRAWLARALVIDPVNRGAAWRAWGAATEPTPSTRTAALAVEFLRDLAAMSPPLLVTEHALRPGNGGPAPEGGEAGAVCWYELTHELLGPAILSANAKWEKVRQGEDAGRLEVARRQAEQLQERAKRWLAGDAAALLSPEELGAAEEWSGWPEVRQRGLATDEINNLIEKSRAKYTQDLLRKYRWLKGLLTAVGLLLAAVVVLAVFIYRLQADLLEKEKKERDNMRDQAERAEEEKEQRGQVNGLLHVFLKLITEGDNEPIQDIGDGPGFLQGIASVRQHIRGRDGARVNFLDDPSLIRQCDDLEYLEAQRLNRALQVERTQIVLGPDQGHRNEVEGVALGGPDGLLLATACADKGGVRVWHLAQVEPNKQRGLPLPPSHAGKITGAVAVAFGGEDRSWLAAAFRNGGVCAWRLDQDGRPLAGSPLEVLPPGEDFENAWNGVAWRPGPGRPFVAAVAGENAKGRVPKKCLWAWELSPEGGEPKTADVLGNEAADWTTALAFAPDGDLLITALRDGTLLSWRCEGRFIILQDKGGRTEFAGAGRKGAGPRPVPAGHEANRLLNKLACGVINHAVPSGERIPVLVSAGEDHTARMWDLRNGKELLVIQHPCPVRGVALDAPESLLATAGRDGRVRLWSLRQQRGPGAAAEWQDAGYQLLTLTGHKSMLTDVALSPAPNRSVLASGSDDHTARVWSPDPQPGPTLLAGLYDYGWFAFSPDLDVVAGCDKAVARRAPLVLRLGERPAWEKDRPLWQRWLPSDYKGEVTRRVAFAPRGADFSLATLHNDRVLRLWAGRGESPAEAHLSGIPLDERKLFDPNYCRIAFSDRGTHVACSVDPYTVGVFSLAGRRPGEGFKPCLVVGKDYLGKYFQGNPEKVIYGFALDPEGKHLALALADENIHVLDVPGDGQAKPGEPVFLSTGAARQGRQAVYAVAYSPSGRRLAAACKDNTVRVWKLGGQDPATLAWVLEKKDSHDQGATMTVHTADVRRVTFRPGGAREDELASADDDGIACVWQLGEPGHYHLLCRFGERLSGIQALAYDREGEKLATASDGGEVRVYLTDVQKLKEEAQRHLQRVDKPSGLPPLVGP